MLTRISVIALNTYREAVRARVLHGLFALALVTAGYAMVVGQFALRSSMRVLSDLGAASISMYAIVVAIVLGATSLYRELELKTIFPILARPIHRSEYLVGKYLGTLCTLLVFVTANAGILLLALAAMSTERPMPAVVVLLGSIGTALLVAWRVPRTRTYVPIPWAAVVTALGWWLAVNAPDDRRVVVGAAALAIAEVGIVTAIATVFSSFSSPFLTATFTFGVFIVGRSADTLAHLPERLFGHAIHQSAVWLSKIVPNLMLYVPPRSLLTGEAVGASLSEYLLLAWGQALAWAVVLIAVASMIFRRRDFL
jgi:ABC-type transport system involved in multi-copper enzyme maturation permease subunit